LFATRGYEQTTATEIAQSVGLTERTFFRHFSDNREVLFYGQDRFVQAFLDGVDSAPPGASAIEMVAACAPAIRGALVSERAPCSLSHAAIGDRAEPGAAGARAAQARGVWRHPCSASRSRNGSARASSDCSPTSQPTCSACY